jgi:hypothetical protein
MSRRREREAGVVMFVTVLLLALMGMMGLAALQTASSDREAAGYYNRESASFYAAEAGAAHGRALVRTVSERGALPPFPSESAPRTIGDAALYDVEGALPRYYGDPAFPNPIRYERDAGVYAGGGNLQLRGQKFTQTLWQINVVGRGADGSSTRLEVMQSKLLSSGY